MTGRDTATSLDSIPDEDEGSSPINQGSNQSEQQGSSESTSDQGASTAETSGSSGGDDAPEVDEVPEHASPPSLPQDAVFEILKNERRRITLKYLMEHDGTVNLSDLAEHVAVRENDTTPQTLTSTERKRAYVGLYQCHLPKMDELGAVDFNRDRGIIHLGPNVDQLKPYLDGPEDPDPWPRYYLALAGANSAVFVASFAGTLVLQGSLFPLVTSVVGALAVLSFGVLAFVHYRRWDSGESEGSLKDR